jgi:hypothetical protein
MADTTIPAGLGTNNRKNFLEYKYILHAAKPQRSFFMNKLKAFSVVLAGFMLLSVLGYASCKPFTFIEPPLPPGGTRVPGENTTDKLAWLESNADSRNTYIVEVNANENVAPRIFEYTGATDVKIVIRGIGENRTLRLASHGTMFTVRPNVELILDSNITIIGHSQNTGPMVNVDGGKFVMRTGSRISGNDRGSGDGGGVYVGSGFFFMTGGTISNNTANDGGGVYLVGNGDNLNFKMRGGIISGNSAVSGGGGGVYVRNGYRTRNDISHSFYFIEGGTISDNTARKWGGGIYVANSKSPWLSHSGSAVIKGNVVKDEEGNILSKKGHEWACLWSNGFRWQDR